VLEFFAKATASSAIRKDDKRWKKVTDAMDMLKNDGDRAPAGGAHSTLP
jgi:hypothetical protein